MTPRERLAGLRGAEYFDAWEALWRHEISPKVHAEIRAIKDRSGRFTLADLVEMNDRFALPFKTFVEQLEKDRLVSSGLYARLPPIGKLRKQFGETKCHAR